MIQILFVFVKWVAGKRIGAVYTNSEDLENVGRKVGIYTGEVNFILIGVIYTVYSCEILEFLCNILYTDINADTANAAIGDLVHPIPYCPEFFRAEFKSVVSTCILKM